MAMLKGFKQSDMAISAALAVAVTAAVGCTVMAVRQDRMNRRLNQLQNVAEVNASVTLNLVNAIGRMNAEKNQ